MKDHDLQTMMSALGATVNIIAEKQAAKEGRQVEVKDVVGLFPEMIELIVAKYGFKITEEEIMQRVRLIARMTGAANV